MKADLHQYDYLIVKNINRYIQVSLKLIRTNNLETNLLIF